MSPFSSVHFNFNYRVPSKLYPHPEPAALASRSASRRCSWGLPDEHLRGDLSGVLRGGV